ncbi:hypothetical protein EYF80_037094 [Liparis tanakae]|uniref:Uncharacterized protein n=1 Tax=Liparis tanakae TaxID=230148 RepID=A0A4Z2GIU9_9TELE|nr:hypothetical protein EYF80_037094 [Liparis tanakae]
MNIREPFSFLASRCDVHPSPALGVSSLAAGRGLENAGRDGDIVRSPVTLSPSVVATGRRGGVALLT